MPSLTRLQFYEYGYAEIAMELGIITPSEYFRYVHYQMYLSLRGKGFKKKDAILVVADKTKCSESTVWRSVHFFSC